MSNNSNPIANSPSLIPEFTLTFDPSRMSTPIESISRHLPIFSREVLPVLDCTPFIHLVKTTTETIPYSFGNNSNWIAALETKGKYLESTFIAFASFIHNVSFGIFYSALDLTLPFFTGETNPTYTFYSEKYARQTALSAASFALSVIGMVSGKYATIGLWGLSALLMERSRSALVEEISTHSIDVIRENAEVIDSVVNGLANYFNVPPQNRIQNLRERIQRVQNIQEIKNLAQTFFVQAFGPLFMGNQRSNQTGQQPPHQFSLTDLSFLSQ